MRLKPKDMTTSNLEIERFLQKLHDKKWLNRDDRNFWEIGPRSHLELRTMMEAVAGQDGKDGGGEGSSTDAAIGLNHGLAPLPQIIFY